MTNIHTAADTIIVVGAIWLVGYWLTGILVEIVAATRKSLARRKRVRDGERFAAARRAARIECEARMRREGYWDNYEIQAAMDAAGRKAAPGYRP